MLGGGWDEPNYMFIDPDAQSPFLRAPNIGFRCVKYIEPESIPKVAMEPVFSIRRDLTKAKPASDELFRAYRSLYSYDKKPLHATVEPYGKDEEFWAAEKITYTAAYGNERAIAYLFLPKKGKPPYQTVLSFPDPMPFSCARFRFFLQFLNFPDLLNPSLRVAALSCSPSIRAPSKEAMAWNRIWRTPAATGATTLSCGRKTPRVLSTTLRPVPSLISVRWPTSASVGARSWAV